MVGSKNKNEILQIFEDKINGIFTMDECLKFGLSIRNEWEEKNELQESTGDMKGIVLGMDRVEGECLKIRSENRDLKMELNMLKEEAKKTINYYCQKLSLSVIMEMLEKLTSTQNETSPKSSRKRLYSYLSLPIEEKGIFRGKK
jgi:hypothetical protein